MTYTHMTRFIATAAGILGSAAFVALASLPGVAQSTTTQESSSETRTYPGPGETPSGSPSVPGTSSVDDPGRTQDQPDQEARRDSNSAPQSPTIELYERGRDGVVDPAEIPSGSEQEPYNTDVNSSLPASPLTVAQDSRGEDVEDGPSAVGEGFPGPGETPSGSPSVPGVSEVDDPGLQDEMEGNMGRPSMPERGAMNSPSQNDGPSAVDEGVPGPGETPSGSPSVPGVSVYDDPNEEPNSEMMSPGQDSVEDDGQDGPSAVDEGVPGPGETPSGSPSVPGVSGVDDPGKRN
jgi:hypothetical protein